MIGAFIFNPYPTKKEKDKTFISCNAGSVDMSNFSLTEKKNKNSIKVKEIKK